MLTVKTALKKLIKGTFIEELPWFFLSFRIIPSLVTGVTLTVVMLGCPFRKQLDLIRDAVIQILETEETCSGKLREDTPVWVCSFGQRSRLPAVYYSQREKWCVTLIPLWDKWSQYLHQVRYRYGSVTIVKFLSHLTSSLTVVPQTELAMNLHKEEPTHNPKLSMLSSQVSTPRMENSSPAKILVSISILYLSPQVSMQDSGTGWLDVQNYILTVTSLFWTVSMLRTANFII